MNIVTLLLSAQRNWEVTVIVHRVIYTVNVNSRRQDYNEKVSRV